MFEKRGTARSPSRPAVALVLAVSLTACTSTVIIETAETEGTVRSRPISTIGPMPLQARSWREVVVSIRGLDLSEIRRRELSVMASYTDCQGDGIDLDELYANDASLNTVWLGANVKVEGPVRSFVDEEAFNSRAAVCLQIVGSSALGAKLRSNTVTLKP